MIVKTQEEREILREGGKILAAILHDTAQQCVPGITLEELDAYARKRMEAENVKPSFLGYGHPPFPAVLCISVNEGMVHGIPGSYPLKEGDILTLDGGIWHRGLCTDSSVTTGVGNISKEDQKLLYAAQEARAAQVAAAVVGNTVGDLGAASQAVAEKYGYDYPDELGGHGVGKKVHESPFIATYGKKGKGEVLVEGMVLAVEPILVQGSGRIKLADDGWLYESVDGSRSAQYEHTIIVGVDEAEVLTEFTAEE